MFALILSVCIQLSSGDDSCQQYIVDARPTIDECMRLLDAHPQKQNDRYLSCGWIPANELPVATGESLESALARINGGA